MPKSRLAIIVLLVFPAVLTVLAHAHPEVRWRLDILRYKMTGKLPDVELGWLLKTLPPGGGQVYLRNLARTQNPYASIVNPRTSGADIDAGQAIFKRECAACHGVDGHGSAVSLFDDQNRNGDSDWALYSTISRGVEGTGMLAQDLAEVEIWQTIAYIRHEYSRGRETEREVLAARPAPARVTAERLLTSEIEPHNWLTYSGSLDGKRHSKLEQINKDNIGGLKLAWVYQGSNQDDFVEATPLVVDGVLITTEPPGTVLALEADTGKAIWRYEHSLPDDLRICCGPVNRGVAVGETSVFVGTLDAHLIALDIATGELKWEVETARHDHGYSNTAAPLVVEDKVLVGVGGGEYGIRGFLDAYDVATGERIWRLETIPEPGLEGSETWPGDSWRHGGGPTWMTGSYDAQSGLVYWSTGNPGPDFNNFNRQGDNLFTNSILAIDPDTGERAWHFQFTPEDVHDYDANHVPIIADLDIDGVTERVVLSATKNGFFYVLNSRTGAYVSSTQISRQTWALSMDESGRPVRDPNATPRETGTLVYPGPAGGANWQPTSFNPDLGLAFVTAKEGGAIFFSKDEPIVIGEKYRGGITVGQPDEDRYHFLLAVDPARAEIVWKHRIGLVSGGSLSTQSGLVFWGNAGIFQALNAEDGQVLWESRLGGHIASAPMTYAVGGQQYVAVSAGRGLFVFAL